MKLLTKVKIINWHYFWNECFDIKPIVFLTGVNGSGKSTLIDALQVVLLGNTSGNFFNKAASEKSARTLSGYLRGELGDTVDGGFKYLRNGRFTSYIALQYYDDLNNVNFVMGCVFDTFDDGSNDHHFFYLESKIPDNEFILNNVPMEYKTLSKFFSENYDKNSFQFFDTNKLYQEFLKRKFGGLKQRYFDLFKRATSFSPISNITEFITDYVCDPQKDINIATLQDNIVQYKKLENEALNIEKRVKRLEEISNAYELYSKQKENLTVAKYILEKCQLEQCYDKLKNYNKQIEKNNKRVSEIESELKEFESNLEDFERKKNLLIADKASNDTFRVTEELKREKKEVVDKINKINSNIETVKSILNRYITSFYNAANLLSENLDKLDIDLLGEDTLNEVDDLKDSAKDIKNITVSFRENYLSDLSKLDKDALNEFRDSLFLFKNKGSSLSVSLNKAIQELDKKIRSLKDQEVEMKKGTKPYDARLVYIKKALESELEREFNKRIEVSIFADLIDIDDLSWSNAIEGFLYGQKFNLFVAPKYYNEAYKILRKLLEQYKFYGTALVDEEKIIERNFKCEDESLAEEIVTDHDGARAYANFLIGRLHKARDINDARASGNGITKECDIYRNFALSRLNPRTYQESFIGRNVDNRFIDQKAKQLSQLSSNLEYLRRIKNVVDEVNKLEVFTYTEIDNYFILLSGISDLPGLRKNYDYIEGELNGGDTPLSESLDNRIKDVEDDIKSVHELKDRVIVEKANLLKDNEQIINEKISNEQKIAKDKEDSINTNYDPFLVNDVALPLYESKLKEGKRIFEIFQEYNIEFSRLQYLVNNMKNQVIKLRRDYLQDYHLSYDAESEDNARFEEELKEYRDVKLPEYREKIQDSYEKATKQFKDDFIFNLREAIGDVEDQIENLNLALKQSSFGKDLYRFTVKPSVVYRRYYDMLKDDLILETGKDDSAFIEKYKDVMEELFRQIVDVGDGTKSGLLEENVRKFTDYRSYLDFDLIVYNKDTGDEQRLSKMIKKKSGGETQTPFYISVLASFAQLYHINSEGELGNTVRLIIFDEAFSKMDKARMTEAIRLLKKLNLQVILSAPSDKVPDISPLVDETLIVLRDKNRSCVGLFEKDEAK